MNQWVLPRDTHAKSRILLSSANSRGLLLKTYLKRLSLLHPNFITTTPRGDNSGGFTKSGDRHSQDQHRPDRELCRNLSKT